MKDDLGSLARDLTSAARDVDPRKLVQVEAANVKRDWQQAWADIRGMPHIGRSVTYDVKATPTGAEAQIGPDLDRTQGPLGGIVDAGSSQAGPIRPVTGRLAQDAADRLESYLSEQVGKAL